MSRSTLLEVEYSPMYNYGLGTGIRGQLTMIGVLTNETVKGRERSPWRGACKRNEGEFFDREHGYFRFVRLSSTI